jgi:predicted phage terminase large subunit-like protein
MSKEEWKEAIKRSLQARLPNSLYEFVRYFWNTVDASPFMDNWHIKAICEHLEAVSDKRIERLIIMLPPRHAKSIIVNVFYPAWDWLKNPSRRILTASVDETLSHGFSEKTRSLIASEKYQDLFGHIVKPSTSQWAKSEYDNTRKGKRLAITTSGGTGKDADLLICDDPIQATKVYSKAERDRAWRWYTGTFMTRGTGQTAGVILVMQRLHEDDVVGKILATPELKERYNILCFPAEYDTNHPVPCVSNIGFVDPRTEDGELLWEQRFSTDWISERRSGLSAQDASAQLQQRPAPAEGLIFKNTMFKMADLSVADVMLNANEVTLSLDATFKDTITSDFVACLVFAKSRGIWYCVGGINKRLDFIKTLDMFKDMIVTYSPTDFLIEDKANGSAIINVLRDALTKNGTSLNNIIAINPKESKESRARACSYRLEQNVLQFCKDVPVVDELIAQSLSFPMAKHDDLVDAMTQFVEQKLAKRQVYSSSELDFTGAFF